jgi:hypothetical protein
MTNRGIFGFRRLTGIGPFSFSEPEDITREELEETILTIAEVRDLNLEDLNATDKEIIYRELSNTLFSEPESTFFRECMTSEWAVSWERGVRDITTESSSELETLVTKADGCYSMVTADGFAPALIFGESSSDICIPCMLQKLR